jgi:hypothetical protein
MYTKEIAMKKKCPSLVLAFSLLLFSVPAFANVGAIAGSNSILINGGTTSNPTYKIVSASAVGGAVYTGVVDTLVDSDTLSFAITTDEDNNSVNPFYADGVFDKDAQVPELTVTVSSSTVTGITASYGPDGYQTGTGWDGFTANNAPQILIDSAGGDLATATCNVSTSTAGKLVDFNVTNGGSDYDSSSPPEAVVVGGPHLLRITDTSSAHYGRVFLITNNTTTTLDLDFSILADGETGNTSTFFSQGIAVEVVRAPTLGNVFGISSPPTNWNTASSFFGIDTADWIYVWDPARGGYSTLFYISGGWVDGWYGLATVRESMNNMVIYPDEAFIVAKRTSGNVTLEVEGTVSAETQKLFLPETNDQMLCNNPYGMSLLLAELIPSTAIGSANTKFRPGSSDDGNLDYVTVLSGSTWKRYWYNSSFNSAVTEMKVANARTPSGGSISGSDIFIGSGDIDSMQTCTDASGSGATIHNTDGNFTKLSSSEITQDLTGFTITLSGIQGYMLNDAGTHEVNATTGENVDTNGTGSVVYSNISGSYEVVGGASGYVIIEKQRDIKFKSDEGSPDWTIGDAGTGYSASTPARWWAIGGGASTIAHGTVLGTSFSVSPGGSGSGYTSAPQIVISGGGWRYTDSAPQGDVEIGASDGIIISRRAANGVKAFIEPINPSN